MQDALPLSPTSWSLALTLFTLHGLSLQLKDPEKSHPLRWPESKEQLLLQSKSQLRSLLCNNQCCNIFGNLLSDIIPCISLSSACKKSVLTASSHISISDQLFPYQGGNSHFAMETKPFLQAHNAHPYIRPLQDQVCLSWQRAMDPSLISRVTHQPRSAWKHVASILKLRNWRCGNWLCQA